MVHAISGLVLVLTLCVFPCAVNTKPRFKDAAHMAEHARSKKKNKIQPEEPEPVKTAEMDRAEGEQPIAQPSIAAQEHNPVEVSTPSSSVPPAAPQEVPPPDGPKTALELQL
jgi:hypothetical protein